MSPSAGTPRRTYRADDELYEAAQAKAAARGETLTDVILRALRAYTGPWPNRDAEIVWLREQVALAILALEKAGIDHRTVLKVEADDE